MRLLELFCGTGSMGRAFAQLGFEVVSLDSDPEAGATHTCNVLDFYYMHYPPGHARITVERERPGGPGT